MWSEGALLLDEGTVMISRPDRDGDEGCFWGGVVCGESWVLILFGESVPSISRDDESVFFCAETMCSALFSGVEVWTRQRSDHF